MLINFIKNKIQKAIDRRSSIVEYIGDIGDTSIIYSPTILRLQGILFAGSIYLSEENNSIIVVDNNFLRLNKKQQECVMYHELGHIVDMRENGVDNITDKSSEYRADEYAVSKIGYDAVIETLNKILVDAMIIDKDPLRDRITHLIYLRNTQ